MLGLWLLQNTNRKSHAGSWSHWLVWQYEVSAVALKLLQALLQKHSLGNCTTDIPWQTAIRERHIISSCNTLSFWMVRYWMFVNNWSSFVLPELNSLKKSTAEFIHPFLLYRLLREWTSQHLQEFSTAITQTKNIMTMKVTHKYKPNVQ